MGLLVVEGGPLSFSQLTQRLKISRGSVSTNTRLLERLGVIERVARRGAREDWFDLTPTPFGRLLDGSAARIRKAQSVVRQAKAGLPEASAATQRRLDALGAFYEALGRCFVELADRFSDER